MTTSETARRRAGTKTSSRVAQLETRFFAGDDEGVHANRKLACILLAKASMQGHRLANKTLKTLMAQEQ
jgi:TPR repeat protein